jgi:hypothetical protein
MGAEPVIGSIAKAMEPVTTGPAHGIQAGS